MRRRTLLRVGLAGAGVLALAGSAWWVWRPAWRQGRLTGDGRSLFLALADAILDGLLPEEPRQRADVLAQWEQDLVATVAALPDTLQRELRQLSALLLSAPGRRWLTGLDSDWSQVSRQQVAAALQSMRYATAPLPQQAYHALRDLGIAAYVSNPERWTLIGYHGQLPVGAAE